MKLILFYENFQFCREFFFLTKKYFLLRNNKFTDYESKIGYLYIKLVGHL